MLQLCRHRDKRKNKMKATNTHPLPPPAGPHFHRQKQQAASSCLTRLPLWAPCAAKCIIPPALGPGAVQLHSSMTVCLPHLYKQAACCKPQHPQQRMETDTEPSLSPSHYLFGIPGKYQPAHHVGLRPKKVSGFSETRNSFKFPTQACTEWAVLMLCTQVQSLPNTPETQHQE